MSSSRRGLPSNVVSINVRAKKSNDYHNPGTTVVQRMNLVFTGTINTQPTDTYQWAINGVAVTIANGYLQNETGTTYQVDALGDIGDGM